MYLYVQVPGYPVVTFFNNYRITCTELQITDYYEGTYYSTSTGLYLDFTSSTTFIVPGYNYDIFIGTGSTRVIRYTYFITRYPVPIVHSSSSVILRTQVVVLSSWLRHFVQCLDFFGFLLFFFLPSLVSFLFLCLKCRASLHPWVQNKFKDDTHLYETHPTATNDKIQMAKFPVLMFDGQYIHLKQRTRYQGTSGKT